MKTLVHIKNRALAMTEYLIVLAIVAIAAIAVVGLFGKQIKRAFTRSTGALAGQEVNVDPTILESSKQQTKQDDMGTFDSEVKAPRK